MAATLCWIIGFSAVLASIGLGLRRRALRKRWHACPGRVLQRGIGPTNAAVAAEPLYRFEPKVRYEYVVDGKRYENDRISFVARIGSEKLAWKIARSLPDAVTVYYDPQDPAISIIRKDSCILVVCLSVLGFFAILIGTALFLAERHPE